MRAAACASSRASPSLGTAAPQAAPSRRSVLARRDFALRSGLARAHGEAGSIVSATCVTVHCRPSVTIERWVSASPSHWNRRWPNGVRRDDRSVPPAGAAGPHLFWGAPRWVLARHGRQGGLAAAAGPESAR